jgi:hypothetical protein
MRLEFVSKELVCTQLVLKFLRENNSSKSTTFPKI